MTRGSGMTRRALWLAPLLSLPLHGIYHWQRIEQGFASYAALYALLWLLYLVSLIGFGRRRGGISVRAVVAFAVLFRLVHLGHEPFLSDDLYRYYWDGKVQYAGINPYRYPADAPELVRLRDVHWEEINHRDMPTLYPPLAQAAFLAVYALGKSPWGYRVAFLLFDLGLILVLMRLAHELRALPQQVLAYAWNPLPIQEFAGHGHVDALALFFFWLAFLALTCKRPLAGQASLGLSVLSKLIGGIVWPTFVRRVNIMKGALAFAIPVALGYLAYADRGFRALKNLSYFARHWEFNASLFYLARSVLGSGDRARLACLVALAAVVALLWWKDRRDLRASAVAVLAWATLTTTLHPWYVTWLLPFACFLRLRSVLWLTLACGLAYYSRFELLAGRGWHDSPLVLLVEYAIFYPLLAVDLIGLYRKANETGSADSRA